jgi:hypothetical protein
MQIAGISFQKGFQVLEMSITSISIPSPMFYIGVFHIGFYN